MKKKLFSILATVCVLAALIIPFATPVSALPPPTLTQVKIRATDPFNATYNGTSNIAYPADFFGSGFAPGSVFSVTNVDFYSWDSGAAVKDTNVTVTGITQDGANLDTHFTGTIHVASGTVHRPLDGVVTISGPVSSDYLYSALIVGDFPRPFSVSPTNNFAFGVSAFSDAAGTVPLGGVIAQGQHVWYKVTLDQPSTTFADIMGGQLAVRFPNGATYHPTAGYGAATPGGGGPNLSARDIPEISNGNAFSAMCTTFYSANVADLDLSGLLVAEADYGFTADNPGINGVAEMGSPLNVSDTRTISLQMFGNLTVTKMVNLSGAGPAGVTQDFSVTVTGLSGTTPGPYTHTFRLVDGVLNTGSPFDNPWTIENLSPGLYVVFETSPGGNWNLTYSTVSGQVQIASGGQGSETVTNTYRPGSLQVNKVVNLHGAPATGINATFTITVTGPSYPGGITHDVHVVDGVIKPSSDSPWMLGSLIPGVYTVSENTPVPANFVTSGGGGVTINAGQPSSSTVFNDYLFPGTTIQTPIGASPNPVPTGGADVTITVHDTNSGNVQLDNPTMDLAITPSGGSTTHVAMTFAGSSDGDSVHLNANQTWTWTYVYHVTVPTQFLATGSAYYQGNLVTGPLEQAGTSVRLAPRVPATSDVGLGILIAGFAGAMLYLLRRRLKRA